MLELWFKCQDCGSNVRIVVQMSELWFGAISGLGMGWMVGWDLCAWLFYEHRFAMLIIEFEKNMFTFDGIRHFRKPNF